MKALLPAWETFVIFYWKGPSLPSRCCFFTIPSPCFQVKGEDCSSKTPGNWQSGNIYVIGVGREKRLYYIAKRTPEWRGGGV